MTTKEIEEDSSIENIQTYFKRVFYVLERWMKVINEEENDVMSALVVDQLIKSVIIKFDAVFGLQVRNIEEANSNCMEKIRIMKEACS